MNVKKEISHIMAHQHLFQKFSSRLKESCLIVD